MVSSYARFYAFRLTPHANLKNSIMDFARSHHIRAGFVVTCVGSLEQHHLRFANAKTDSIIKGYFEIVSLTGTVNEDGCHLHISLADENGKTIGGHLLNENLVYTTAEIVIGDLTELSFERREDETYGFRELIVTHKSR